MNKVTLGILYVILYALCLIVYFTPIGGSFHDQILNIVFLVPPLLAVIGGIAAVSAYGVDNPHGRSYLYITLGLSSWFIGELLFAVYDIVLHIDPYPSLADAFYLVAYPLILIGIIRQLEDKEGITPMRSLILSIMSIVLSILVFDVSILPAYSSTAGFIENIIAISYGMGDLILIVSICHIMLFTMDFSGGKLYRIWTYIMIGVVFMLLGDLCYAMYKEQYNSDIPLFKRIDLLWVLSYLAFSYGLFGIQFMIRDVQNRVRQKLT